MNTAQTLEALLFASGRPIKIASLPKVLGIDQAAVRVAMDAVAAHLNVSGSGIRLFESETEVALVTSPDVSDAVREFLRKDVMGELTRPSLETLSIVAYRGPVTKAEIEQIRGVNCSLIVRNLLLRGLIIEQDDGVKMQPVYTLSTDALRFFGVTRVEDLPDYGELHTNAKIAQLLATLSVAPEPAV